MEGALGGIAREDAKQCERALKLWDALPDYSIRPGSNVVFKNGLYNRVKHDDSGECGPGEQVVFVNLELYKDLKPPEPTILTVGDARRVKAGEVQGVFVLDPHDDDAMVFEITNYHFSPHSALEVEMACDEVPDDEPFTWGGSGYSYQKVTDGLVVWARDFLEAVGVLADAKNREVAQRCAVRIAAAKPNAARLASLKRILKAVQKEMNDLKERASQNKAYARGKWREARAEMLAAARAGEAGSR